MSKEQLILWLANRISKFPNRHIDKPEPQDLPDGWYWKLYQSPNGTQWEVHKDTGSGTQYITPYDFNNYVDFYYRRSL